MKNKLCLICMAFMVVITLVAFGCAAPAPTPPPAPEPAPAPEPVRIGALIPLTGGLQHEGAKIQKGIELALEDAGWEVAGSKIELAIEDSATDPPTAVDKARKLVEMDKVSMIIGPQHSGAAAAILPYVEETNIVMVKTGAFPVPLIAKSPYVFVPMGGLRQGSFKMADYAYEKMGFREVSVMGPDYIAGRSFLGGFTARFTELGGTIVQEQWFPFGGTDYGPYLAAVESADACAAWVTGAGGLVFNQQYHEYGVNKKMPLIAPWISGILNEDTLPDLGDTCLGVKGGATYSSTIDNELNRRIVQVYRDKYGERPGDQAVWAYICMQVALESLKATGGDTAPEALREAILGLNIDTPAGPLRFTPEGVGIRNSYIVETVKEEGEYFWKVVEVYPDVTPPPSPPPPPGK